MKHVSKIIRRLALLLVSAALPAFSQTYSSALDDDFTGASGGTPAGWTDIGFDTDPGSTVIESGSVVEITDTRGNGGPQFIQSGTFSAAPGFRLTIDVDSTTANAGSEPEVLTGVGDFGACVFLPRFNAVTKTFAVSIIGASSGTFTLPSGPHLPSYAGGAFSYVVTADTDSFRITSTTDGYDSGDILFSGLGVAGFDSIDDLGASPSVLLGMESAGSPPVGTPSSVAFDHVLFETAVAPEIAVEQPAATNIADGGSKAFGDVTVDSTSSLVFTIKNTGNSDLNGLTITVDGADAALFQVTANPTAPVAAAGSTTFTVEFSPLNAGMKTAGLHIANDDPDESSFDITLTGNAIAPEIAVEQPPGTDLTSGDTADFGIVATGGTTNLVFTIKNTGAGDLTGLTIDIDGADAGLFTVTADPTAPVAGPAGSTTFTVQFAPVDTGDKTATLHIANNDDDEDPFDINLTGIGADPGAALAFDGGNDFVEIPAHADFSTPTCTVEAWVKPGSGMADWARIWGTENNKADLIAMTGSQKLFSFAPVINGAHVFATATTGWTPGQWYHVAGVIDSNKIRLFVDGVQVAATSYSGTWAGDAGKRYLAKSVSPALFKGVIDEVRYWSYPRNCDQIAQARAGELTGAESGLVAYYPLNQGFALEDNSAITSATDATGHGHTGSLQNFSLADGNANSNWTTPGGVTTGVLAPTPVFAEISVLGNGIDILNGDTTPSDTDDTDFGVPDVEVTRTYTIENSGNQDLTITGIDFTGLFAADFSLNGSISFPTVIPGGNSTTFSVTVPADTVHVRKVTVTVHNTEDCDEGDFAFVIQSAPPIEVTTTATSIVVADGTDGGGTLNVLESAPNSIHFTNPERSFRVNNLTVTFGDTGGLSLAGITSVTLNGNSGSENLNVGAFTNSFPSLTINGNQGDDVVTFSGDVTFASGRSLNVDLQNDHATPGTDSVVFDTGANLALSGSGSATVRASKSVRFASGAGIAVVNGALIVEANQQATPSAGTFAGVNLTGASLQSTGTGAITINGKGGATGDGNYGIYLSAASSISSTSSAGGAGTISLTGGGGGGVNNAAGIVLDGASGAPSVTSAAGAITVIGQGGTAAGQGARGVYLSSGATIAGSGAATVTVTGTGGASGSNLRNGIQVSGAGTAITSVNGAITLTAVGGSGGIGANNHGFSADLGGSVLASGAASISITGTEGTGTSAFEGIAVLGSASTVSTSTGSGNITLTADRLNVDPTSAVISAGTHTVTLLPRSAGRAITLGGIDSATELGLRGNELARVTAGTLNIGNVATGAVAMVGPVTLGNPGTVNVTSGSTISLGAYTFATGGGNVTLNAAGVITAASTSVDVDAGIGSLSFGGSRQLSFDISSSVANTGYDQLNVAGGVNITGCSLFLTGAYVPLKGQTYVLINNDGSDAISGSFAGLPEGSIVTFNGIPLAISYVGGSGNDVTLAYAAPALTATKASINVVEGSTATNSGTFSDLQNNVTSVTASLGTLTPNLGAGTWSWSYVAPSGPSGPTTVTVTATDSSSPPLSSTVTFTVSITNASPTAQAQTVTFLEDSGANVITLGATDPGNDALTYQIVSPPLATKGSLGAVSGNTVAFTPAANATGTTTFTFKVVDVDGAASGNATVTVNITPVNDAPSFVVGPYRAHPPHTSSAQTAIGYATAITDGDAEAVQTLNFIVTRVAGLPGLFTTEPTISPTGVLSYQPNGISGWARFSAVLHDNGGTANGGIDSSAPQLFTIRIGNEQVITFDSIPTKTYEDPPFDLTATGGASGQPVTFAVVSGPATISGNTLTITGAGTVTVRASQASFGDYAQAEDVDQTFVVNKAPQEITFTNPGAHIFGEAPFALTATGGHSNLPVTFQVISGPATVSGDMLTLTGIGTVTVRANQAGNANYLAAPAVTLSFDSEVHSDYTVISWSSNMRVFDNSGNGDTLAISQPSAGNIKYAAAGRTFSVNGGANLTGDSGSVSLSVATSISVFNAGGSDTVNVGAFTTALPSLTIDGGTGDDTVNLNGDITFAAGASLDLDLQNDNATPGADSVVVAANSNIATSGAGTIVIKVSKSIALNSGGSLDTTNGNLTLEANQQAVATTGNFTGISLTTAAVRTTGSGTLSVKGRGGNASGGTQIGVRVQTGGVISSTSPAQLVIEGTGGASAGGANYGVFVGGTGSSVNTTGAPIRIVGTEGSGPSGFGIDLVTSGTISSGGVSGAVVLIANSVNIDATANIAGAASVTLAPLTNSVSLALGSGTNPIGGPLSLADSELDRVTTGTLILGSVSSGDITASATITRPSATLIRLLGTGGISLTSGPLDSNGGNIQFNNAGPVTASYIGVDVSTGAGTLSLSATESVAIAINSAVANSGYTQMNVTGQINLNGATLALSGSHVPQPGQTFTIVNNDNADAIAGTFAGLPEGAIIPFNGVDLQISYVGGTGNDVTLAQAAPAITVNYTSRTVNEGSTATNAGTFIDLQGNNTVTLTANVGSVTKDDGAGTWSWSLASAVSPATVIITATDNSVPPHVTTINFSLLVTNLPPVASALNVTVLEDSGATPISLTATDPGGDPITYSIVADVPAAKGTLTAGGGSLYFFTPAPDTNGATSFTFKATDNEAASSLVTAVSITVTPVNDAPSFVIGPDKTHLFGTTANQAFVGWATSISDGDAEVSQTLSFTVTEIGSSGMFTTPPAINAGGGLTYKPNGTAGTATFSVAVSDNGGTANGGIDTSPAQTFTITVSDSFTAGTYSGLASPAVGTTPAQSNLGLFSGTLAATGVFSGKVNFGGTNLTFSATFDDTTGDASGDNGATLAYDLHLDLTGATDKITGTVTQLASGDVSDVDADMATFSATNHVPDQFLKDGDNTKNGLYTVVFPPRISQAGLTTSDYPQGYGIGTITVTPTGTVSIAGTVADGTAITASAPLSQTYAWPMAVIIKSTATVTGMTLGGFLQFDTAPADSDVSGSDLQWFRPAKAGAAYYPGGWSQGILIDVVGAKSTIPVGSSVLPGLGPVDPAGNAILEFTDGLLTSSISKFLNIATNNAVTKIPTTDTTYTLTVTTTTGVGALGGSFTHPDSATIKPVIKGNVLQKGANAGGYGFFLSPVPSGSPTPGESGAVRLMAR